VARRMEVHPEDAGLLAAAGRRIVMQIRTENQRVAFGHLIVTVFLPNIQAALRYDKQVELADCVSLGMLPPGSRQAETAANVMGKRKRGEFNDRHMASSPPACRFIS